MYLDISSNQGVIDWQAVKTNEGINGVILRATTRSNTLDVTTKRNYEDILHNMSDVDEISVYKFSYARDYITARIECRKCLDELDRNGVRFDYLYLDLEGFGAGDYTREQASAVIVGYMDEMRLFGYSRKFALYFNYNYLKNIIDPIWWQIPIWLARYNDTMGDTFGANIVLWQYTSKGRIDGIKTDVDLSREVIET